MNVSRIFLGLACTAGAAFAVALFGLGGCGSSNSAELFFASLPDGATLSDGTGGNGQCLRSSDCPTDNECTNNACVPFIRCQNSLGCPDRQVCDAITSRCVACVGPGDCAADESCISNKCRKQCRSDIQCAPLGLLCDHASGLCVHCVAMTDCAMNQHCTAGECVRNVCNPGERSCTGNALVTCSSTGDAFGPPQDCGAQGCVATEGAARCGAGSGDDAAPPTDGGTEIDAGPPVEAGGCAVTPGNVCVALPRFTEPSQTVDGVGNEFCNIAPTVFRLVDLPYTNPTPPPNLPTVVTLRAGWSEMYLHLHIHVDDPNILVDPTGTKLWNGDNVQLFFAGTANLGGAYSGTEPGGPTHIMISPPTPAGGATRALYDYYRFGASPLVSAVPASYYAGRLVPGGYEIEVRHPWAASSEPRVSGARFGFDFLIGVHDSALAAGFEAEGALYNAPVSGTLNCGTTVATPGCDNRTWCVTTLQ